MRGHARSLVYIPQPLYCAASRRCSGRLDWIAQYDITRGRGNEWEFRLITLFTLHHFHYTTQVNTQHFSSMQCTINMTVIVIFQVTRYFYLLDTSHVLNSMRYRRDTGFLFSSAVTWLRSCILNWPPQCPQWVALLWQACTSTCAKAIPVSFRFFRFLYPDFVHPSCLGPLGLLS